MFKFLFFIFFSVTIFIFLKNKKLKLTIQFKKKISNNDIFEIEQSLSLNCFTMYSTLNSGQSIHHALISIAENHPLNSVQNLFKSFSQAYQSSKSFDSALALIEQKYKACSLIQRMCMFFQINKHQGASISESLLRMSEDIHLYNLRKAEEQVQKIPVYLMAPLMLCIFPITFIVIFFPLWLSFAQ